MKITTILLALSATTLLLPACKKAASGTTAMEYQIKTVNRSAIINTPVTAGNIQWTSGTASTTMIKLEAKNSNSAEVEFKSEVAQQISLFAPVSASLGNVSLPAGTYSEVEFKIEIAPVGNNAAFQLAGQFTSGTGTVIPVVFQVNNMFDIKAEQSNVTITDNGSTTALTILNLAPLTNGINQNMLNNATVTNGSIIISATSNTALYNIILANLIQSQEEEVEHH